ncbi:Imm42 family immunity protein [Cerasicoccus arenae]|uniref:Uncharacterized protein n=1 Tax=Cerasicoccus arenae TaxID=424488 RepID=A0A8J3GEU2_9BACT|nr:Imm42 family immunity protein [Cerasicoccus arenae]MBK1858531.1 hypothetical protein [Cerasicoccus arenae]GHC06129.1 hypothetical protein GCM10007047_23980 [Cerasicoccus arenae]
MDFGKREVFAIEAYATKVDSKRQWVFGRMCCWVNGLPLGNVNQPMCMLNVTADFLRVKLRTLDNLSNSTLSSLTARMAFKCLDQALYTEGIEPIDDPLGDNFDYRYDFLTNGGESFDGSKSFIVRAEQQVQIIFCNDGDEIQSGTVSVDAFQESVSAFLRWIETPDE